MRRRSRQVARFGHASSVGLVGVFSAQQVYTVCMGMERFLMTVNQVSMHSNDHVSTVLRHGRHILRTSEQIFDHNICKETASPLCLLPHQLL